METARGSRVAAPRFVVVLARGYEEGTGTRPRRLLDESDLPGLLGALRQRDKSTAVSLLRQLY